VTGPLLLADAPFQLYRAFFGLPDSIKGADGKPVNALLGAVNQVLYSAEREKPRAVVVCFGLESARYREEAYPPYHAQRPPMPDELAHQWSLAPSLFEALGWIVEDTDEFEADDVMGSLAAQEEAAGGRALILTGDRDMFQCATEKVHVLLQQRGKEGPEEFGPDEVRGRYGVDP
jgi:5'-3' exonuclease